MTHCSLKITRLCRRNIRRSRESFNRNGIRQFHRTDFHIRGIRKVSYRLALYDLDNVFTVFNVFAVIIYFPVSVPNGSGHGRIGKTYAVYRLYYNAVVASLVSYKGRAFYFHYVSVFEIRNLQRRNGFLRSYFAARPDRYADCYGIVLPCKLYITCYVIVDSTAGRIYFRGHASQPVILKTIFIGKTVFPRSGAQIKNFFRRIGPSVVHHARATAVFIL